MAIGKRIKDLKVWITTPQHTRKGSNVTATKTNLGVEYKCSSFCLVKRRKNSEEKTKREHYIISNFTVLILQTFTRFKKRCQALHKLFNVLIFFNLCKYRLNKKAWNWEPTPVSPSCVFLKRFENLCYMQWIKHSFNFLFKTISWLLLGTVIIPYQKEIKFGSLISKGRKRKYLSHSVPAQPALIAPSLWIVLKLCPCLQ